LFKRKISISETLGIRQHDDYDGEPLIRAEDVEPAEPVESDEEAEVDVDDGAESDPDVVLRCWVALLIGYHG
jgi:hypothetical protein